MCIRDSGIAVDDTIHFMSRLRFELLKGLSLPYAVKRTYISTGKAIIITGMVLLSGFMTLLSSSFGGTFYVGLLISLCLFLSLIHISEPTRQAESSYAVFC